MPKQNTIIFTEEGSALNKYEEELNKTATDIYNQIKKNSRKINMISAVLGGALGGFMVGSLLGTTIAKEPVYNSRGAVIDYNLSTKKLGIVVLETIGIFILIALSMATIKMYTEINKNREKSVTLTNYTFNRCFDRLLKQYVQTDTQKLHYIRSVALIVNNMSEPELNRLRTLALTGLEENADGDYKINQKHLAEATKIISNFIQHNPDIECNISKIMHGEEPTTYFLSNMSQKVR